MDSELSGPSADQDADMGAPPKNAKAEPRAAHVQWSLLARELDIAARGSDGDIFPWAFGVFEMNP